MICFPNAKINLGLNVVSKRPDGYHNIETVFYPVPVQDALEIIEAEQTSFSQTGLPIEGPPEKNLVMKALARLQEKYTIPPLEIHLFKSIPFGAGLGGGSADAAFMLKLVNEYCRLGLSVNTLEELAATIGADCPFFIQNSPVFASGTGNIFEPVSLSLKKYYIGLVKPDITVSTPEAYALIRPGYPEISLKEMMTTPVEQWKETMVNDFEQVVFPRYPEIRKIKETLYEKGAVFAAMSGSGSSVFGLFDRPVSLKETFPAYYTWEGPLG
ncbi:MAG: 4-(cytidine 5'-diphospho)-2-C-methyl-D-erythritol kinase [Tannerellaceae bacterium]|nr:4-(cytidine 5'-diphospho)-2-C-methyl-D-erythritol kinase [Tannerellaceae bacterium]MCC8197417.1 4-(cytidine 5'-diphospho)-2-C-methyl-D-erythritol kinase [Tannerellaceae bacterium]